MDFIGHDNRNMEHGIPGGSGDQLLWSIVERGNDIPTNYRRIFAALSEPSTREAALEFIDSRPMHWRLSIIRHLVSYYNGAGRELDPASFAPERIERPAFIRDDLGEFYRAYLVYEGTMENYVPSQRYLDNYFIMTGDGSDSLNPVPDFDRIRARVRDAVAASNLDRRWETAFLLHFGMGRSGSSPATSESERAAERRENEEFSNRFREWLWNVESEDPEIARWIADARRNCPRR
ncbi:TPA: hypothetical protein EYP38_02565 [Candidatus Micrarchaeota archaeon]|nr:hypothetical protein [Candidatus Micrarchaeota archaeon]